MASTSKGARSAAILAASEAEGRLEADATRRPHVNLFVQRSLIEESAFHHFPDGRFRARAVYHDVWSLPRRFLSGSGSGDTF